MAQRQLPPRYMVRQVQGVYERINLRFRPSSNEYKAKDLQTVRLLSATGESVSYRKGKTSAHNLNQRATVEQAAREKFQVRKYSRLMLEATVVWLVTRLAWLIFTAFAVPLEANLDANTATSAAFTFRMLAARWLQWDSIWYLGIAQHGYTSQQSTAYFPLFPLLIRSFTLLFGDHWLLAVLTVANLGTWVGLVGVGLLAADGANQDNQEKSAHMGLRMAVAYPLAFFLFAPYGDGLFLAAATFSLLWMRREKWKLAMLCVGLSLVLRPTGVILLAPLVYEYGRHNNWWQRAALSDARFWATLGRFILLISGSLLGLGLYMLFLWQKFGDPLQFLHAEQQYWHHSTIVNLVRQPASAGPALVWSYNQARALIDPAALVVFTVLTIIGARKLPLSYTLYMIGLLTLIAISPRPNRLGVFVSAGRYLTAGAPIFILLGRLAERRPWLDTLLVGCGFLLQACLAAFFLDGGWLV